MYKHEGLMMISDNFNKLFDLIIFIDGDLKIRDYFFSDEFESILDRKEKNKIIFNVISHIETSRLSKTVSTLKIDVNGKRKSFSVNTIPNGDSYFILINEVIDSKVPYNTGEQLPGFLEEFSIPFQIYNNEFDVSFESPSAKLLFDQEMFNIFKHPVITKNLKRISENKKTVLYKDLEINNRYIKLKLSFHKVDDNNISYLVEFSQSQVESNNDMYKEMFFSLFNSQEYSVEVYDLEYRLTDLNENALDSYGKKYKEEIFGTYLYENKNISSRIQTSLNRQLPTREINVVSTDNGNKYYDIQYTPLFKHNISYVIQIYDITDSVNSSRQIEESKNFQELSNEVSNIFFIEVNLNTGNIYLNEAYIERFGFKGVQNFKHIINNNDLIKIQDSITLSNGFDVPIINGELRFLDINQNSIWVSCKTKVIDDGLHKKVFIIFRDIDNEIKIKSQMVINNERLHLLIDSSDISIFDWQCMDNIFYLSKNFYLGHNMIHDDPNMKNFVNGKDFNIDFFKFFKKSDLYKFNEHILGAFNNMNKKFDFQLPLHINDRELWYKFDGKIIEYVNETPVRVIGLVQNVNAQKENNNIKDSLIRTDTLTHLYNRFKFNEDISSRYFAGEYSIISIDANNLKLVNDCFGHSYGDMLITTVADLIRKIFRNYRSYRIGGDEFIVSVPHCDIDKINLMIDEYITATQNTFIDDIHINPSVSFGVAMNNEGTTIKEICNVAEQRMYQFKMLNSTKVLNNLIKGMQNYLYDKTTVTINHVSNMRKMANLMAKAINFSKNQTDELLLTTELHDIGKVSIPEFILKKKNLSDEEKTIMMSHTNNGYKIATSAKLSLKVAEGILYHHENYNGTGYPKNLVSLDIPLYSRIISILDFYDLTKEASSKQHALEQTVKSKGIRFDPRLVDIFVTLISKHPTL